MIDIVVKALFELFCLVCGISSERKETIETYFAIGFIVFALLFLVSILTLIWLY